MSDTSPTPGLDRIITGGTGYIPQKLRCTDGTILSIGAGPNWYCRPRPSTSAALAEVPLDYPGPYTHLEVFASGSEEPHGYMPVAVARALVLAHGGEHHEQPEHQVLRDLTQPEPEDAAAPAKLARINDAAAILQAHKDGGL